MFLNRLIKALGVLMICLSLCWVGFDIQNWIAGETGLWLTLQRVFIRLGCGFAGGLLCLFFPEVKLEMFKYGRASKTKNRSRFAKRLEGKSEYDYDEDEVVELD